MTPSPSPARRFVLPECRVRVQRKPRVLAWTYPWTVTYPTPVNLQAVEVTEFEDWEDAMDFVGTLLRMYKGIPLAVKEID